MIKLKLKEIAQVIDGNLDSKYFSIDFSGNIEIDSRKIKPGDIFVAINGNRVNGNSYIKEAVRNGAIAIISEENDPNLCIIQVRDGVKNSKEIDQPAVVAMGKLAKYVLQKLPNILKISVTGSSGKTTTKDLLSDLAKLIGPVVAPIGSFNNEIGLPQTIFKCSEETKVLISEMGAREKGNISHLCEIVNPHISIILNIGSAHIEIFGSKENIVEAKSEIVQDLKETDFAILNKDDEYFGKISSKTKAKIISFGTKDADVLATEISFDELNRAQFKLNYKGQNSLVKLKIIGKHQVHNALAAAAAFLIKGVDLNKIAEILSNSVAKSELRMQYFESKTGIKVLNDSYNANPESMRAGLEVLQSIGNGKNTWAVLGEMRELGKESKIMHEKIAQLIIDFKIRNTLIVGQGAKYIYDYLMLNNYLGSTNYVETVEEAIKNCKVLLAKNDLVLVKASRSIGLERVAKAIENDFSENLLNKTQEVDQ